MSEPATSLSYCAALVRDQAPGRYLATLFAPARARAALFGLYAFDHEISKVRQVVTEPMAGLIRFQWWRDALETIAAECPAPAHPVARALQDAWRDLKISRATLEAAIDARERELERDSPETLAALEQHLAATSSGLVLAALQLLGVGVGDQRAREAGHQVGLAIGLADLLAEIDVDRERALLLPRDLLSRCGITPAAVQEASSSREFAPAIRELASTAREHLREARRSRRAVPSRALPALLPGALVGHRLRCLHALGAKAGPGRRTALVPLLLLGHRALGIF
jgi:phytoene synthase